MWTSPSPSLILKITITLLSLTSQTMSSTYQAHARQESEGDKEFSFWGSSNTIASENDCDQLVGNEAEAEFGETSKRKFFKFEHSPFLHGNHQFSGISDPSRSKAIAEGKRDLMKMIQDMPESSHELSFQDMVVEKQVLQPETVQNEASVNNTLMQSSSSKVPLKKLNKKNKKKENKSNRPGQISRVESMDSETFLLKMFFPTSLYWMKKDKVKNGSKVSPRPSFQESIKQVNKEWTIKRFFQPGENTGSSSDKSRYVDRSFSFSQGCWPFFHDAKSKAKKLGGRIT